MGGLRVVGSTLMAASALWIGIAFARGSSMTNYASLSPAAISHLEANLPGAYAEALADQSDNARFIQVSLSLAPILFLSGAIFFAAGAVVGAIRTHVGDRNDV
jgi:hypothetical protein